MTPDQMHKLVEANVRRHGFHVYAVQSDVLPRYLYTVGLSTRIATELILAGGVFYSLDEALAIVNAVGNELLAGASNDRTFDLAALGSFHLQPASVPWVSELMLGAVRYRGGVPPTLQLVADPAHSTMDTPRMMSGEPAQDPVWKWSTAVWPYDCAANATVTTNLRYLRGERATEAARWERDEWEIFAGPGGDVDIKDMRVIPVGTALGIDASLREVLLLSVGKASKRSPDSADWHPWNLA